MDPVNKVYSCEVKDVFSGDDLVCLVDLNVENLWKKIRVRLHGVDTPNAVRCEPDSDAGKIRSLVRTLVKGRRGLLTVVAQKDSSWVCKLEVEATGGSGLVNVNQKLIEMGYVFKRSAS